MITERMKVMMRGEPNNIIRKPFTNLHLPREEVFTMDSLTTCLDDCPQNIWNKF